jgi:flagellar basal-body rod modification protein FlgD
MDIAGTTAANQSSSGTTGTGTAANATATLGKNEFLSLLTIQLKNQDPLNPMDSTSFTAQLAQFSSLEQLTNLNSSITDLLSSQQAATSAGFIGKKVSVSGNTVQLSETANLHYSLAGNAAKTTLSIYDGTGALVRTVAGASQTAGDQTYTWDGKDQYGNVLAPGQYSFTVAAADSADKPVGAETLSVGTVTGVTFENNTALLTIDGRWKVRQGDIIQIIGGA